MDTNGDVSSGVSLYTTKDSSSSTASSTLSETPKFVGGSVVPIVYIDWVVDGVFFGELLGGFSGTVYKWEQDIDVTRQELDYFVDTFEALTDVIVDVVAYDYDRITGGQDMTFFRVNLIPWSGGGSSSSGVCVVCCSIWSSILLATTMFTMML
eukprot:CAMPEP_0118685994 /NCGR_PEP_ID=MMETSP0800-20121206/7563_1 /TAXON_ID=210618 ORGANISM="Striatella unipunctata, Strain CCMP2910" /NCGR_SAMPLE_ID=MMETSP0800 /ASSEMBLY_ACC=CAM_ASM_000638 /LENGTH=152 /DNA_ID=CAMNT_0006582983 /DNA_START=156 /DNA_END=614 /DNA_ORIENTATION=-